VDVPNLVRAMSDLLQRSVGPMVRIETRFALDLPCALVDANQLELALLNLAVNARDAMPDGGVITIAAKEQGVGTGQVDGLAPGRYVCLSVADTGEGMDDATLARALEPFFTTKGVGKGTGLGLSMVQGLAEQSRGCLVLRSWKGKGTTVEVWLPVAEAKPMASARELAGPRSAPERAIQGLTVMIVDDDALVLRNTAALLEDLGHAVVQASSGQQALDLLRAAGTVDLVITDQAMPGMTGIQLAHALRIEWPNRPVLLATGYTELPQEGAANLIRLSKPFRQDTLARAIAECMRRHAETATVVPFRPKHG
jgi:CheY-like chemotaxis protein/anti-sigma regulatory factor (Ser/Thr protein kinase)